MGIAQDMQLCKPFWILQFFKKLHFWNSTALSQVLIEIIQIYSLLLFSA